MLNEYAAFCAGTVIVMLWSLIIVENTYLIFTIIKTSKNEFLQNTVAHNLFVASMLVSIFAVLGYF